MKEKDLVVSVKCPCCKQVKRVIVNDDDYEKFISSKTNKAVDYFPYLKPAERELFISGLCGICWAKELSGTYKGDYFNRL